MDSSFHGSVAEFIAELYGRDISIVDKVAAYGGDINDSCVLTLSNGERIFLKENREKESDFFEAEVRGLIEKNVPAAKKEQAV